MKIGIGNVGSTSLKTKIVEIGEDDRIAVLGEANLDRMRSAGESTFTCGTGDGPRTKTAVDICGFEAGIRHVLDWYVRTGVIGKISEIQAMGFKCVMGETNGANDLTPAILDEMKKFYFVAPLHNPPYVEAIGEFRKVLDVPMVGLFEPSFHYTLPEYRRYFGLPWEWHESGIRRLGFHGASHRYLTAAAIRVMGSETFRLITVHLGGSSSLCAVQNGRSVDISTCFTPNSGVMQGARTGDCDPSALLFAMKQFGLSPDQAQEQISSSAGLKGLAGIGTEDFRDIKEAAAAGNRRAQIAIDCFVDGIRKTIAGFASGMGGVDCVVFSGGIGENGCELRARCLENMDFMGLRLDPERNKACCGGQALISTDDSRAGIYVIPTNEEVVVGYFTKKVVELGRDLTPEEMTFRL